MAHGAAFWGCSEQAPTSKHDGVCLLEYHLGDVRFGVCYNLALLVSPTPSDHLCPLHNKGASAGPKDVRVAIIAPLIINGGLLRLENLFDGSGRTWPRPRATKPPEMAPVLTTSPRLSHLDLPAPHARGPQAAAFLTTAPSKRPEQTNLVRNLRQRRLSAQEVRLGDRNSWPIQIQKPGSPRRHAPGADQRDRCARW